MKREEEEKRLRKEWLGTSLRLSNVMMNWIENACALVGYRHDHLGGVFRSTAAGLLES